VGAAGGALLLLLSAGGALLLLLAAGGALLLLLAAGGALLLLLAAGGVLLLLLAFTLELLWQKDEPLAHSVNFSQVAVFPEHSSAYGSPKTERVTSCSVMELPSQRQTSVPFDHETSLIGSKSVVSVLSV